MAVHSIGHSEGHPRDICGPLKEQQWSVWLRLRCMGSSGKQAEEEGGAGWIWEVLREPC